MNNKYLYLLMIALYCAISTGCHKKDNNTNSGNNNNKGTDTTVSFDFSWSDFPVSIAIIDFNSTVTDTVTNTFRWEFSDGKMSTEPRPKHFFGISGSFQVKLTINGDYDHTRTKTIDVKYPVRYKGSGTMVEGDTVAFTQDAEPGNTFVWYFGDGTTNSTDWSPKHVYAKAGSYVTKLRVNDNYDAYIASYASKTMEIIKDPNIGAMIGNRPWNFTKRYTDTQFGIDSTSVLTGEQINIMYIDKVTVDWPGSTYSQSDYLRYDKNQSKNNLLVFTGLNKKLVYDYVADTMHFSYFYGNAGGHGVPRYIKVYVEGSNK